MEDMKKKLNEEQLEQVAGGVSTKNLRRVTQWESGCINYECKLCGMRGELFKDHAAGCAVSNWPHPYNGTRASELLQVHNSCWSCKHLVKKSVDYSEIYCGHKD